MVEEHQLSDARLFCQPYACLPTGMSPALAAANKLLRRELSVVNEHVRSGAKIQQRGIKFAPPGLVIGGIDNGSIRCIEAESEAALRVIQPAGGYGRIADGHPVSSGQFREIACGRHRAQVHRRVGQRHLRFKDALQTVTAKKVRTETIEVKFILL